MAPIVRNYLPFSISAIALLLLAFVPMPGGSASAQQCGVGICKVAPQLSVPQSEDDAVFFDFDLQQGTDSETFTLAANGLCIALGLNEENDLQVVEDVPPGWDLSDIQCEESSGISVTHIDNGAVFSCNTQSETFIECNFINVLNTPVPTLSEWGMIAAAAGLGLIGVFFVLRNRKVKTA